MSGISAMGPPTGLRAEAGDGSIHLSWTPPASSNPDAYSVVVAHGDPEVPDRRLTSNEPALTVRGLANGVHVEATGGGAPAATEATTVSWTPPPDPALPHPPAAILEYRVTTSPDSGVAAVDVPGTAASALVTGLADQSRYTFTVSARRGRDWSGPSDPSNPVWPGDDVPWYLPILVTAYLVALVAVAVLYKYPTAPWSGFKASFPGTIAQVPGYLIFVTIGHAAGGPAVPDKITSFVIAFIVGYREEVFRDLIKKVSDIILKPANGSPSS
jgi:hypothetical protein